MEKVEGFLSSKPGFDTRELHRTPEAPTLGGGGIGGKSGSELFHLDGAGLLVD